MFPGFLPFGRGSFAIDLVVVALVFILPLFTYSLYEIKVKKNYQRHKRLQLFIASALLVTLLIFEIDLRFYGWRHLAEVSPHYDTLMYPVLLIHLVFAISTVALWALIIYRALKFFPNPPIPSEHSATHKALAKFGTIGLYMTILTGWLFYYIAFVA